MVVCLLGKKTTFYCEKMTPPLSWKTDPLLLERKQGLSLNDLLVNFEDSARREQLGENPLNNFYGFLIKRVDFIRKETAPAEKRIRILTRMPFIPLNNYSFLKQLLEDKRWLIAEASRDYFYQSAMKDHSIRNWKNRIARYIERGAIPLPLLRGDEELWQQFTQQVKQEQQITIQSAKGEHSTIPLMLTEKLVYLLGVIDGDGHLSKHQVHIVDYSKKHIEQLQQFIQELFRVTGAIREGKEGNYYILLVNGKWLVRLINFLTGHPLGRKYAALREPLILREKPFQHLRGAYWRGLFDADASYKQGVTFVTTAKTLADDLYNYLDYKKISYRTKEKDTIGNLSYVVYIPTGYRTNLYSQIGSWHPEKNQEFLSLLKRRRMGEKEGFQGIPKQTLTSEGYFNFYHLDSSILVVNVGSILNQIRKKMVISRKKLAQDLSISYETITAYENGRAFPPLRNIIKFVELTNQKLMPFLEENRLFYYKSHLTIQLPLKPTAFLKQAMQYLHPRNGSNITILTKDEHFFEEMKSYFSLPSSLTISQRRFCTRVLHNFLITFGNYQNVK